MYKSLLFLFGVIWALSSCSQQNNIWYFGKKAGLDFNTTSSQPAPVVLVDGVMNTNEGCASICDNQGRLLFYSNGVTVYNWHHQVMLNGDGLLGNISSVQSCIIVPVPGNDSIFYIFTADAVENSFVNGYSYSVVNINHDNGDGEIIIKNRVLWGSGTERLVAARHANGSDIWVITNDNNSNIFRAWLVNCGGLSLTPVVSVTGAVLDQHFTTNTGMMKVSPDSKQLCQTHFPEAETTASNFCQLFDFDNATGILSNNRAITFSDARIVSCEFSPDSKLLYLTNPELKKIEQVEAKLISTPAIVASRISINTSPSTIYGIQAAPDGKIYLAEISPLLSVINRPNVKGAGCNYTYGKIELAPGYSYISLPAFINDLSYSPDNGFSYTILDSCTGRVQFNGLTKMSGTIDWEWDFGDNTVSDLQNPVHTFVPANKSYTVHIKITSLSGCGVTERTKVIYPTGILASAAFDFEAQCDSGYVRFTNRSTISPDTSGIRYAWSFGDNTASAVISPVHPYTDAGIYDVRLDIITSAACLNKTVTQRLNLDKLNITASPDQEIDPGQTVQLSTSGGGSLFTWTPSAWLSDSSISNPVSTPQNNILYKIVVHNDAGCSDSDYVKIKVRPLPGIYMPTGFTPDNDGLNDLVRPIITKEFSLQHFIIYNRWGQKIFETAEKGVGWNGMINGVIQDTGAYAWVINATDTRTNQQQNLKGTFVIIRR